MKYDEFLKLVEERANIDNDGDALNATEATLTTLAERLFNHEAMQLAAQLPPQIAAFLTGEAAHRAFSLDEFYEKVSRRESLGADIARRHARAVMSVVAETVSPGELRDVLAQLPDDYVQLFTFGSDGQWREREGK